MTVAGEACGGHRSGGPGVAGRVPASATAAGAAGSAAAGGRLRFGAAVNVTVWLQRCLVRWAVPGSGLANGVAIVNFSVFRDLAGPAWVGGGRGGG